MKKLIEQILKFSIVGVIAFFVDFVIYLLVTVVLGKFNVGTMASRAIGGFFGFTVSVIVNYILSMKYVFVRKENISRKKEFVIFLILSLIGLGLNEVLLVFGSWFFDNYFADFAVNYTNWVSIIDKIFATGVVMVYNFISRKIFLEDHKKEEPAQNSDK